MRPGLCSQRRSRGGLPGRPLQLVRLWRDQRDIGPPQSFGRGVTRTSLLSRRLLFVVGKGGVGRTTVSLSLALAAAREGKRVLLIELEGARSLERGFQALRSAADAPRN